MELLTRDDKILAHLFGSYHLSSSSLGGSRFKSKSSTLLELFPGKNKMIRFVEKNITYVNWDIHSHTDTYRERPPTCEFWLFGKRVFVSLTVLGKDIMLEWIICFSKDLSMYSEKWNLFIHISSTPSADGMIKFSTSKWHRVWR